MVKRVRIYMVVAGVCAGDRGLGTSNWYIY